ncbi:MAG: hypothetical protein GVY15_12485 [Bacteroidetes bacterium]|jgi:hypothetical protein|nr:hypothetical protein [Bacteroidota bacterium]
MPHGFNRLQEPNLQTISGGCTDICRFSKLKSRVSLRQKEMKRSQIDLSHLSDEELLNEAKSSKPSPLFDAFFIGLLIGIIIFGVAASNFGFFLLVPLFLIYIMLKKPKRHKALQRELGKRGL